ncbi:hypothetical protein CLOP_g14535 [Closterium sp. NIES-67]|nr:hypothetical protein CLOP_g14535 [Closterium sp. NIES-67]
MAPVSCQGCRSGSIARWNSNSCSGFVAGRRGVVERSAARCRRLAVRAGPNDEASVTPQKTEQQQQTDTEKEELAAKLAAAEAEAAALRLELEQRRLEKAGNLIRMKPNSDVYIDGTGARETIFQGPVVTGKDGKKGAVRSWGFTETELLSAQEGEEGEGAGGGKDSDGVVTRRLLIGAGLAVLALPVALYDIPLTVAPPTKPLFFYVVPLVRLQLALQAIVSQADSLDVVALRSQLRFAVGTVDSVRENLVSATVLLDDKSQQPAKELAFEVIDYLQQADFGNYFENMGAPSASQQLEFLSFSLKSIKAAISRLDKFFKYVPSEVVEAANQQVNPSFNVAEADADAEPTVPEGSTIVTQSDEL